MDIFKLFRPKDKPSSIGKKWTCPEPKSEIKPLETKQLSTPEANIKESDFVQDQILKTTSGNNPHDAS